MPNDWKLLEEFEAQKKAELDADALSEFLKRRYRESGQDIVGDGDSFAPLPQKDDGNNISDSAWTKLKEESDYPLTPDEQDDSQTEAGDGSFNRDLLGKVRFRKTGKKKESGQK